MIENGEFNREDTINIVNWFSIKACQIIFFVLITFKTLELSVLNDLFPFTWLNNFLLYLLAICSLLQLIGRKFYLKPFFVFCLFLISTSLVYLLSGNNTLVTEVIIVYCIGISGKVDVFLKIMLKALVFSVLLVIVAMIIGIIPNLVQYRLSQPRYSLGFRLAIYPPGLLYSITGLVILLKKGDLNIFTSVFLFFINGLVMFLCSGRTYFFQLLLVFILLGGAKLAKNYFRIKSISFFLYISCLIAILTSLFFSVYWAYSYNPMDNIAQKLNTLFTNRLLFWSRYMDMYDLKLFGQPIIIESSEQTLRTGLGGITLDNTYLYLLIHLGIVALLIFLFLLSKLLYRLYRINDYVSLILWLSMIITMLSGNNALSLNRNFLLLQFALLIIPIKHSKSYDENYIGGNR